MTDIATETAAGIDFPIANHSGLELSSLLDDPGMRELARGLSSWVANTRAAIGGTSMFDRGMFTPPDNIYDEMRAARNAVRYDDVVSGVAEITEAFAFSGIKWESKDPDVSDFFNQLAATLDMDSVIRRIWREEYQCSQAIVAMTWGSKTYTLKGLTPEGKKRKKKLSAYVPTSVTVLDSTKVIPVGRGPLNVEMLAWQATAWEIGAWQQVLNGERFDPTMADFFVGKYTPDRDEEMELRELGVDPTRLLLMNPLLVHRHTATKADYERFAEVRLKSCFPLLDMKRQLMAADRAALVGAANYILLVKKGTKEEPARPAELENLRENYSVIAKIPVIISDHRLSIEIITPTTDLTLNREKYDVIDTRLRERLLLTLTGGSGGKQETGVTLSFAVARAMENRRHMLKRFIEHAIAHAVLDHPLNDGVFDEEPNFVYTPRNISLGFDAALMQAILALRTSRDISRETILELVGLDQETEAMRREIESDLYDEVFGTLALPGQGEDGQPVDPNAPPAKTPPAQVTGATGGRPPGGGKPPANPAKITPKTPSGASKKAGS